MNDILTSSFRASPGAICPDPSTIVECDDDRVRTHRSGEGRGRRLLVLEDDPVLARALSRRLLQEGLAGDEVTTLAAARAALSARRYDCLVLDRVVPDGDAIALVEEVQRRPVRPPVLVLSGLGDTGERIRGLHLGADEYLAKPVLLDEIVLRARKLMDRVAVAEGELVRLGSVVLDRARCRVFVDGDEMRLGPRQYAVFQYLVAHRHRLVSVAELLEHCWDGERHVFANPVHSQINRLRRTFRGHLWFEAVRGVGYVVRADDDPGRGGAPRPAGGVAGRSGGVVR